MSKILDGKVILVTGGTGSFGQKFIQTLLNDHSPKRVIVFSRDEWKQSEMQKRFSDPRLRYFLGDVRDIERLRRAFHGVNIVVHAAALKQVPMLEYNPFEAVQTNVIGAQNIINAAIDREVEKVVALSTDKAVNPVNLYGATKLCAEKLFVDGNAYSGEARTRFSVVRYGNVVGSRGSVVPFFLQEKKTGVLPVTDTRMTRFWITLEGGVALVLSALTHMSGGEIFVPRIPSMKVIDIAKAIGPECRLKNVGIRPGEKLHEVLVTEEESSRTVDMKEFFVIRPQFEWVKEPRNLSGKPLPEGFRYASDTNTQWLTEVQLSQMLKNFESPEPSERTRTEKRIAAKV